MRHFIIYIRRINIFDQAEKDSFAYFVNVKDSFSRVEQIFNSQ